MQVALENLHISGLAQDCSNSIANALEFLWPYTKQDNFAINHEYVLAA